MNELRSIVKTRKELISRKDKFNALITVKKKTMDINKSTFDKIISNKTRLCFL